MYIRSQKFGNFRHWLSDVSTFEMKNFDTHVVFICNAFNYKPKISTKPQNGAFDIGGLQTYLRPGKVPFATVPNISLAR